MFTTTLANILSPTGLQVITILLLAGILACLVIIIRDKRPVNAASSATKNQTAETAVQNREATPRFGEEDFLRFHREGQVLQALLRLMSEREPRSREIRLQLLSRICDGPALDSLNVDPFRLIRAEEAYARGEEDSIPNGILAHVTLAGIKLPKKV